MFVRHLARSAYKPHSYFRMCSSSPAPILVKKGGSSILQRLSSFLVGLGLGYSVNNYLVLEELNDSNKKFGNILEGMQNRISALEKKK
mmetsp:Transcript_19376/g.19501  ORF Transcript_19376/g.19501 Transcript_19376/m.19501 type:complete len:88 (+) Transcript_19376:89-352(+)